MELVLLVASVICFFAAAILAWGSGGWRNALVPVGLFLFALAALWPHLVIGLNR